MERNWNRFDNITEKYMPYMGEGETMASQTVTAVNKLVYRWFNDGDVYDNTQYIKGWYNDLSSYANWLYANGNKPIKDTLDGIYTCCTEPEYETLLWKLACLTLREAYLEKLNKKPCVGSIYDCEGHFEVVEPEEEEW